MNFLRILVITFATISLTEVANQKLYARPGEPSRACASLHDLQEEVRRDEKELPDELAKITAWQKADMSVRLGDAYYDKGIDELLKTPFGEQGIYPYYPFRYAMRHYEEASNQKHNPRARARGLLGLARFYYHGIMLDEHCCDVAQDYFVAHSYFLDAFNELQWATFDQHEDLRARSIAAFYLGEIYYLGDGVPENAYHAKHYFELVSAKKGWDMWAQAGASLRLGQIYYFGEGYTKQDYRTARQFFEYTAFCQNTDLASKIRANVYLGEIEYLGLTGTPDMAAAYTCFKFAEEQGEAWDKCHAAAYLGKMYLHGKGVPENAKIAQHYFEIAGATGVAGIVHDSVSHAWANLHLGEIYHLGLGVARDAARARIFFEIAANQAVDLQTRNLARAYLASYQEQEQDA